MFSTVAWNAWEHGVVVHVHEEIEANRSSRKYSFGATNGSHSDAAVI